MLGNVVVVVEDDNGVVAELVLELVEVVTWEVVLVVVEEEVNVLGSEDSPF